MLSSIFSHVIQPLAQVGKCTFNVTLNLNWTHYDANQALEKMMSQIFLLIVSYNSDIGYIEFHEIIFIISIIIFIS